MYIYIYVYIYIYIVGIYGDGTNHNELDHESATNQK
jgi:hypothetical protein